MSETTIEALAREIDPAAFDHLASRDRYWRHRWETALAAARRVGDLIAHPQARVMPADHIALKAPAAELQRALDYYRGLPSYANGTLLSEAIDKLLGALRQ